MAPAWFQFLLPDESHVRFLSLLLQLQRMPVWVDAITVSGLLLRKTAQVMKALEESFLFLPSFHVPRLPVMPQSLLAPKLYVLFACRDEPRVLLPGISFILVEGEAQHEQLLGLSTVQQLVLLPVVYGERVVVITANGRNLCAVFAEGNP